MASSSGSEVEIYNEEEITRYYFNAGFEYNEIVLFLKKHHNIEMSGRTLLRRLKVYGLKRRYFENEDSLQAKYDSVKNRIREMLGGPDSVAGYRTVWHSLEMEGMRVPRVIVQTLLKELDPSGTESRRSRRLRRRRYENPGPNFAWHIDGYDKLKPWGFSIHGAIDGYSRCLLWLEVTRSNNSPDNIASFYLSTVDSISGCPVELITDLGTENSIVASIQSFFRENEDAHRYVSSPRNQRIEGFWSQFCKQRSSWWRSFFLEFEETGVLDTTSELCREALWFCFSDILQEDLIFVQEHWNTHRIRKSKYQTLCGRPNTLYHLPEQSGTIDYKQVVPVEKFNYHS